MSILKEIISFKKKNLPSRSSFLNADIPLNNRNFKESIQKKKNLSLIAELKRKSPSKGAMRPDMTIEEAVQMYHPYASAMSILTESKYFGGSLRDLEQASKTTSLPLLRKDFIIDPLQVKESRFYHANAYLLISTVLSKNQLEELILVGKEYNMPALVEIQNEKDLELTMQIREIEILGVNNRNLHDLSLDMDNTKRLMNIMPDNIKEKLILVSESGFQKPEDIKKVPPEIDAVLIGSGFMQSNSPEKLLEKMFGQK